MSKPLRVEDEAEAELWSAADWYDAERVGLGDDFLVALRDKLDQVQAQPEAAPFSPDAPEGLPIRQARVSRRFPYLIVYLDLPEAAGHTDHDPEHGVADWRRSATYRP